MSRNLGDRYCSCKFSNCLNWKTYCDDHSSLSSTTAVQYELFHINFSSFHCTGRYELNKLTSLTMCGFIAQLVEHRTGIAEVTGSNPVEALIFFRLLLSNCLKLENLLWWSLFTFIYNCSAIWIISYKLLKIDSLHVEGCVKPPHCADKSKETESCETAAYVKKRIFSLKYISVGIKWN